MFRYADIVLSHSNEAGDRLSKKKLNVFHHPIEQNKALLLNEPFQFDLLIWGKVSPYKGITEFVEHVAQSSVLRNYNILIAGKFDSDVHYQRIVSTKPNNIVVRNQFVSEEEMVKLFQQSRFVLFTYISDSVLSSAALCKSLSYEKEVIGSNIGSFKDLGEKNLIYTYRTFSDLEALLTDLREKKKKRVEAAALRQYIGQTSWSDFSRFVISCIDNMYPERKKSIRGLSNVKIVANEQI
jgi:glycosyltransferase involved in cell wall biosynthesis